MHDRLDAWILEGARPVRRPPRRSSASGRSWSTRLARSVRELVQGVREPRRVKAVYWCYYVAAACVGAATLIAPPRTVEGTLGPVFTTAMSLLLVIGGLVGAATVFGGWWRVERLGIWCALGATGIYTGVVTSLDAAAEVSREAHLGFVLISSGLFVVRLALIRGHDFEPVHPDPVRADPSHPDPAVPTPEGAE